MHPSIGCLLREESGTSDLHGSEGQKTIEMGDGKREKVSDGTLQSFQPAAVPAYPPSLNTEQTFSLDINILRSLFSVTRA